MRTFLAAAVALALVGQAAAYAQATAPKPQGEKQTPTSAAPGKPGEQQKPAPAAPAKPGATAKPPTAVDETAAKPGIPAGGIATDADYVIGAADVLGIIFWRDQEMTGNVTVRPDGMITLPLLRDVKAAGFTPTQLADRIQEAAREYIKDASVTVAVREINSRQVFITGEVTKPGAYTLASTMTVMQLLALAGGVTEWADSQRIAIIRTESGKARTLPFDYKNIARGRKTEQNIVLKPGDTVVVPEK